MFGNMTNSNTAVKTEMIAELKDILADDFNTLVDSFVEDAQRRLRKLKEGIAASDSDMIRTEAHSLKGSSLNLGAQLLPELCSQMENKGKSGDLEGCDIMFLKIESELAQVEAALNFHANR